MWLETRCELTFELEYQTVFILMLRPRSGAQQWIASEQYLIYPWVPVFEFTDDYGNLCQRLVAPLGHFKISTSATIMTADEVDQFPGGAFVDIQNLPDDVLKYLLPSRYCESDRFHELAMELTANQSLGYDQVAILEHWLFNNIHYQADGNQTPLSALEVKRIGSGVCRDLSHLGIALCRSLSIPARLVVGYLHDLNPMELHAWFEAYVAGRWYTFDATQKTKKGGYVAIGYGRDAADVAIYNQFGPATFPIEQNVTVKRLD